MFGSLEDKFRQARLSLMAYMTYPGKKLLFMGTEYAQFREWDYASSLEWFMLDYPNHKAFRDYTASLNEFYLKSSELWEKDFTEDGFGWILPDEADKNLVAFRRYNLDGDYLTVVLNFSGIAQTASFTEAENTGLSVVFDTGNIPSDIVCTKRGARGRATDVCVTLPAFSGAIFKTVSIKNRIVIKNKKQKIKR
jgi:1,4-alpha-glucan branching enzyme